MREWESEFWSQQKDFSTIHTFLRTSDNEQWVYCSPSSGQEYSARPFWSRTPSGGQDVNACAVCTQSRTSHLLTTTAGRLTQTPTRSTATRVTMLVIVHWLSKACRLVPLKGLLTSMENTQALFHHVFHNYGLPDGNISGRGTQFISRVWRMLCEQLCELWELCEPNGKPVARQSAKTRSWADIWEVIAVQFLPELTQPFIHWSHTFPVCPRLPTSCSHGQESLLMTRRWLVQEFWESIHVHLQWAIWQQRAQADQQKGPVNQVNMYAFM